MQRIADGVYWLEAGRYANAYLLEGNLGLTLVDSGPPGRTEALIQEIKGAGFRISDVHQLLLTHAHAGHIGGAARLLRLRRMKVFAHPAEIAAIQGKEPLPRLPGRWGRLKRAWQGLWSRPEPVEALSPVRAGDSLKFSARWQVLHTPGHTPGSLSLYDPLRGILICGDALIHCGGRLRSGALDPGAVDAARSLERIASLYCETLCCGHGPVLRENASEAIRGLAHPA